MKKTFAKLTSLAFGVIIVAGTLSTISSCSKTNPNAIFLGTYAGNFTSGSNSSPDTITISAGSNSSAVVLIERKNALTLNGTVTANSITIPTQNVTILGGTYPTSGTGSLTSGTLALAFTTTINSVSVASGFSGTKQ